MTTKHEGRGIGWLWKIPLIAVAYFVATMIGGALIMAMGMEFPESPELAYSPVRSLLAALVLGAALYLLARGIRGSSAFRWLVLFAFTYISFCVNNQIEAAIFTTMGGFDTMLVFFVIPCALVAGVAALVVKPPDGASVLTTVFSDRPMSAWWWRATLAWLAFPVIYYSFGMLIYPFVADAYEGGELGLVVPSQSVVLSAVTFRSLLFLLVTIPILINWSRSRRSLMLALAAAFTAMVGVVGMIEADWMTTTMRIVHGLEITADSIVHAWVLVTLLVPKSRVAEAELSTVVAD
jgi:hypothetical protein